jgi:hypothetical protein
MFEGVTRKATTEVPCQYIPEFVYCQSTISGELKLQHTRWLAVYTDTFHATAD